MSDRKWHHPDCRSDCTGPTRRKHRRRMPDKSDCNLDPPVGRNGRRTPRPGCKTDCKGPAPSTYNGRKPGRVDCIPAGRPGAYIGCQRRRVHTAKDIRRRRDRSYRRADCTLAQSAGCRLHRTRLRPDCRPDCSVPARRTHKHRTADKSDCRPASMLARMGRRCTANTCTGCSRGT